MPDIHLNLGYQCNNNCLSCPEYKEESMKYVPLVKILQKLKELKDNDRLFITGGEPTIHRSFFCVMEYIRKNSPRTEVVLLSNGRIFSYDDFVKRILKYNICLFYLSLYGINEKDHEAITRTKGSFYQTINGVNNLMRNKKRVEVSIPICKLNYKSLDKDMEKFLNLFKIMPRFRLRLIDLINIKDSEKKIVSVKFSEILPHLNNLLDFLLFKGVDFSLDKMMPLCLLPEKYHKYVTRISKQSLIDFSDSKSKLLKPAFEQMDYTERCTNCNLRQKCNGVYINYIKYVGIEEFK